MSGDWSRHPSVTEVLPGSSSMIMESERVAHVSGTRAAPSVMSWVRESIARIGYAPLRARYQDWS
jgi:hypothetical protein